MLRIYVVKTTLPLTKVQASLPKLVRSQETITILKHGEPVAFLVSRERMESILETLELQSNPAAMKAMRRYRAGKMKFTPLRAEHED